MIKRARNNSISSLTKFVLSLSLLFSLSGAAQAKHLEDPLNSEPAELQTGTQSTTLQTGTQSTTLQTGTQSTTLQTGTRSTTLQTGTQSTTLQGGTAGALIQGGVEHETGPVNILFLLDCSFSMKEKLSGTPKLLLATRVLEESMARIPGDISVGLRVFGQSLDSLPCMATALLVPLGQGNRGSVVSRARELKATGMTPLAYALQNAAEDDFRSVEGKKIIILITDGIDTCGGDPCAVIAMLPQYGIHIKVDVVGVSLHEGERKQLDCIARVSGGKYYDANTASKLIDSISASVDKAISGRVLTPKGKNLETPPELRPLHATPDTPLDQR